MIRVRGPHSLKGNPAPSPASCHRCRPSSDAVPTITSSSVPSIQHLLLSLVSTIVNSLTKAYGSVKSEPRKQHHRISITQSPTTCSLRSPTHRRSLPYPRQKLYKASEHIVNIPTTIPDIPIKYQQSSLPSLITNEPEIQEYSIGGRHGLRKRQDEQP